MATETASTSSAPAPRLHVAPGPHLSASSLTTRRMMLDVLLGLLPVMAMALVVFHWYALLQVGICVVGCLAAESLFAGWRGRRASLGDLSAVVTGVILGLSLPWSAPWYVGLVASFVAIGLGKAVFGGLGQNIFNPAMVGRAFVMISFASVMGATSYVRSDAPLQILTQATPLTAAKEAAGTDLPGLWLMFLGNTNGLFSPSVTGIGTSAPSRNTTKSSVSPGVAAWTISPSSPESATPSPSIEITTSSSRSPALAAGPPSSSAAISAPSRRAVSPSATYTVNSRPIASSMCISEPAEITSRRRGKLLER